MNVRFGFVVTELTVSLANSSLRLPEEQHANGNCCGSASLTGLYHLVFAVWRETALRLFLSLPDHFSGHRAAIEVRQILFITAVSNALPRTGVPLVSSIA